MRTLTQRLADLDDLWPKLKTSRARYAGKVYMLRAVALRCKAIQALGMEKAGVNPAVLLGLVEVLVDPQLVAILWTFRALRARYPMDFWVSAVAPLAFGDLDLPP